MTTMVRAVLFREADWWVAQCLEFDLATQARTLSNLYYELEKMLMGQLKAAHEVGCEPFAGLAPAPERYHTMWEETGFDDLSPKGQLHRFRAPAAPELRLRVADAA